LPVTSGPVWIRLCGATTIHIPEGIFPDSQQRVEEQFAGVEEPGVMQIVLNDTARRYKLHTFAETKASEVLGGLAIRRPAVPGFDEDES
jgi:hypothetical protein